MATEGLTELEDEAVRGSLLSHERIWRQIEADLAPFGVSSTEYSVLALLGAAGRRGIRLSELAEQRMMSTAGLSRLADRLEQRDLVERCRAATDGRGHQLRGAPAGTAYPRPKVSTRPGSTRSRDRAEAHRPEI